MADGDGDGNGDGNGDGGSLAAFEARLAEHRPRNVVVPDGVRRRWRAAHPALAPAASAGGPRSSESDDVDEDGQELEDGDAGEDDAAKEE